MNFPTWGQLVENFCSVKTTPNPQYEDFANRRYNFAASNDSRSCRLIFLKDVLKDKQNKTLSRKGRFIWCRDLKYEGLSPGGLRTLSFTVDKGRKRFYVSENNVLCLPSQVCVSNNRFFKSKQKTFLPFSSVFSYRNSLKMMAKNRGLDLNEFSDLLQKENPYRPGTLVKPRLGYFQPEIDIERINKEGLLLQQHPCGIILGRSYGQNDYVQKEFYRVRFGKTTYEKIHPVQMEIVK